MPSPTAFHLPHEPSTCRWQERWGDWTPPWPAFPQVRELSSEEPNHSHAAWAGRGSNLASCTLHALMGLQLFTSLSLPCSRGLHASSSERFALAASTPQAPRLRGRLLAHLILQSHLTITRGRGPARVWCLGVTTHAGMQTTAPSLLGAV